MNVLEVFDVLLRDEQVNLRDGRIVGYPGGDDVGFPELPLGQEVHGWFVLTPCALVPGETGPGLLHTSLGGNVQGIWNSRFLEGLIQPVVSFTVIRTK